MTTALKAGDQRARRRAAPGLYELQKAAKEGNGDEIAVLQRERKRRLEAADAFRDAGRDDLAEQEQARGGADRGLPARAALRRRAATRSSATSVAEPGATSPKDMGKVM